MSFNTRTPDNVYYNVRINGNSDGSLAVANYAETRSIPLVDNPSEYNFTCIKFNIPISTVPLLIIPVVPYPNTDATKTVYSVSLSYNAFSSAQTFIKWTPMTSALGSDTLSIPRKKLSADAPYTDSNDAYYYCYSYTYFMGLVNNAFQTAFSDLSGQTTLPVGSAPPKFKYDAPSKLFTLVAPSSCYDVNNVATPIKIFMNNDLFNLFGAMPSYNYVQPTLTGNDKQILITSNSAPIDTSGNIQFQQEYVSLFNWMAFKSIIITSSTIPIIPEGIPAVNNSIYTPDNELGGSSAYLPIISSYDALLDSNGYELFQSNIQYAPTGPYKLIEMIGTNPLNSIDLQVYWMDSFGGLHNLLMQSFESCTFTFLMTKRNSN
jgi:hypothetical protein